MTIIKRTCANCAAFNPTPAGDDPACWNLVSFTEQHGTLTHYSVSRGRMTTAPPT